MIVALQPRIVLESIQDLVRWLLCWNGLDAQQVPDWIGHAARKTSIALTKSPLKVLSRKCARTTPSDGVLRTNLVAMRMGSSVRTNLTSAMVNESSLVPI